MVLNLTRITYVSFQMFRGSDLVYFGAIFRLFDALYVKKSAENARTIIHDIFMNLAEFHDNYDNFTSDKRGLKKTRERYLHAKN